MKVLSYICLSGVRISYCRHRDDDDYDDDNNNNNTGSIIESHVIYALTRIKRKKAGSEHLKSHGNYAECHVVEHSPRSIPYSSIS